MISWLWDVIAAFFDYLADTRFNYGNWYKNRRLNRWAKKENKKFQ